jgi:hypothetical protein
VVQPLREIRNQNLASPEIVKAGVNGIRPTRPGGEMIHLAYWSNHHPSRISMEMPRIMHQESRQ